MPVAYSAREAAMATMPIGRRFQMNSATTAPRTRKQIVLCATAGSYRLSGGRSEGHGEIEQQPRPESGRSPRAPTVIGVDAHRAGDVNVRPRYTRHEFLEKERGDDRTCVGVVAHVPQVGDFRVELTAVTAFEW